MNSWKNILVGSDTSIEKAIEILESEPYKILLVVDDGSKLLGTVTDGDIRRGLIRHISMSSSVNLIMEGHPKTALISDTKDAIQKIMKQYGVLQVPLINEDRIVLGIESVYTPSERKKYNNPVILMAGGYGKRLHPLTLHTPKPLLKVGDKPILQSILENFIGVGFHNFLISTHYKAEQFKERFKNGEDWDVSIEYIHEEEPLGTAGFLGLLPKNFSELPVIIMNGDLLTEVNFEKLLSYHNEMGGVATMCVRRYEFQVPYGVIAGDKHKITEIIEKPIHEFFVNAGIYILNKEVYENIVPKQYINMPNLLQGMIDNGHQVNMFPLHENWLDIGRMEDYKQAQVEVGNN